MSFVLHNSSQVQIEAPAPVPAGTAASASTSVWQPGQPIRLSPQPAYRDPSELPTTPHPKPQFLQAAGFGNSVPLSFAASQIVPPSVRVTYGPGVESESSVTWRGGRPWNEVLASAVAPLGYHVVIGRLSAAIEKD